MSEDIVHSSGGNKYNNIIVIIVSLGLFTYGFCSSIVGSLTGLPAFYDYFDFSNTGAQAEYTSSMLGAMNSLYVAGGLIGCAIAGWLADRVGRKVSIQFITTACILAAAFTTGSQNIAMLLSGRALQGIAAGMINVVCPMYHAEVSPVSVRGRMVGTHATFLVIGYAMASWVGLGCYFESTPAIQWRLCLALQMVARFAGTNDVVGNGFGVLFLFVFITFFAGEMDAASYVYASEIFPTWMRAQGIAFSVCGLFCGTLIYTGSAPDAFAAVGWKYYLVFIFVPLACVIFVWFVLPETSGLTLKEIGAIFGDNVVVTDILDGEPVEVDFGFVSTHSKDLEKSS